MNLEDAEELKKSAMDIVKELKKHKRMREKDRSNMTQKAMQNHSANMTWQAMEIEKMEINLHAIAVNCGIADDRGDEYYSEPVDFYPSSFHHYQVKKRMPRVVEARLQTKARG